VNDDQSAQRDKPLDGSSGEAPSISKAQICNSDSASGSPNYYMFPVGA